MKINVGSKNAVKVSAVRETLKLYPNLFQNLEVLGTDVSVEEFGHPIGFDSIINGSNDRAKESFKNCSYSIGLESGLVEVPKTKSGYMEISACTIFDGGNLYHGLSSGFEWPLSVTKGILSGDGDASKLFKDLKITNSNKQGAEEGGIVGVLTNNRMLREEQIKQSLVLALIYLEFPKLR